MRIAEIPVGVGHPCFVIAEVGVNHNGRVDLAHSLIDFACEAGANAVKFQTFSADRLVSKSAKRAQYQIDSTGSDASQYDMLDGLALSESAHRELQAHCHERGIIFMSTPFDEQSADFLESLNVPVYKISSADITNHSLLAHVSQKKRPVIMSTGMATLDEVRDAVAVVIASTQNLVLLQCVSNYPANPEEANLRVMQNYREMFGVSAGFSDHTQGIAVAIAAVTLGAVVVEKHLTLDREMQGPDHRASLDPSGFADLVASIRAVERALGSGVKSPTPSEMVMRDVSRRSLHWRRDIAAGERVMSSDFIALRPGIGIPPSLLQDCVGCTLVCDVRAGELVDRSALGGRR